MVAGHNAVVAEFFGQFANPLGGRAFAHDRAAAYV